MSTVWFPLVAHLQKSRVFHRPAQPYVDLRLQDSRRLLRTRIYHPTLVELGFYFSPTGFFETIYDQRFAPRVPFHIEFSSANFISTSARFPIQRQIPHLPRQLRLTAVQPALYVRGFRAVTGSLTLEFAGRASASISFNPFSIGFTYSGQRAGIEIVHNFDAEQPSLSGLFHWTARRTRFSVLTSMYGNVATVATTDLGVAKVSTFVEANLFTFESAAAFGISIPYRDLNVSVALTRPANTFTVEVDFENMGPKAVKTGFGLYYPASLPKKEDRPGLAA